MAQYVLQLTCKLGATDDENEGAFDTITWVSPTPGVSNLPDPSTAALTGIAPGDSVGFAIKVLDSTGAVQNGYLQWIAVAVTATTQVGNRKARLANNNSPFRIGSASKPNTVLLASKNDSNVDSLASYNDAGTVVTTGGTWVGMPLSTIVKDNPPGRNSGAPATSQYEAVVLCSLTDGGQNTWQFAFDPEMDVSNGN